MLDIPTALRAAERYKRQGRLRDAERAYRGVLADQPGHVPAVLGLAEACRRQGRKDEATQLLLGVLPLAPGSLELTIAIGRLLGDCDEVEGAIASFERAAQLAPAHSEVLRLLAAATKRRRGPPSSGQLTDRLSAGGQLMFARALSRLGRIGDAVPLYRSVVARDPQNEAARSELTRVLLDLGQVDAEVEDALLAAAAADPTSASAQFALGRAWLQTGRLPEAIEAFKKAHELDPSHPYFLSNVVYGHALACSGRAALEEAKRWSLRYEPAGLAAPTPAPRKGRRLRIGYVSPDFRHHVDSYFLVPLLRHHDRASFEVWCYSSVHHPDHVTAAIAQHADHWVPITALSDEQAAARIRKDGIDVLVDLKLHSSQRQLGIFALRPAPVQVCWLSYPGTTGLRAMDFRMSDPHLDPPGSEATHYSERTIQLAETFWCYERYGPSPAVAPPPMLARGQVTFGSFNRVAKVSDAVLALWARLLHRVDGARLIVHAAPGGAALRVMSVLAGHGITYDRIELVGVQTNEAYLDTYRAIDVVLDSYPYNGATTTLDALWMGVPVVTLVGPTAGGRAGLSIATNLGLQELVARTPDEYVEIARQLVSDPVRLTTLHMALRERLLASPLMNGPRFAASVEAAYESMWREKHGDEVP